MSRARRIDKPSGALGAALLALALLGCALGQTAFPPSPRLDAGQATATHSAVRPTDFAPSGPTEVAQVVRITDGDTIRVLIDGREHPLRYIGMDTPESVAPGTPVEAFALAATAANAGLVEDRLVVLEKDVSETDRFDRLLRYVWLAPEADPADGADGAWVLVNLELVRSGLAEARAYPPDVKYHDILEAAESEARMAGRGMWAAE